VACTLRCCLMLDRRYHACVFDTRTVGKQALIHHTSRGMASAGGIRSLMSKHMSNAQVYLLRLAGTPMGALHGPGAGPPGAAGDDFGLRLHTNTSIPNFFVLQAVTHACQPAGWNPPLVTWDWTSSWVARSC
jgi:hypothetical protein